MTSQFDTVRFVVRDDLGRTLVERRSVDVATKDAKATARSTARRVMVLRVETFGNVTRERRVATFNR